MIVFGSFQFFDFQLLAHFNSLGFDLDLQSNFNWHLYLWNVFEFYWRNAWLAEANWYLILFLCNNFALLPWRKNEVINTRSVLLSVLYKQWVNEQLLTCITKCDPRSSFLWKLLLLWWLLRLQCKLQNNDDSDAKIVCCSPFLIRIFPCLLWTRSDPGSCLPAFMPSLISFLTN